MMDFADAKQKFTDFLFDAVKADDTTEADRYVASYLLGFIEIGGVEDLHQYEQSKAKRAAAKAKKAAQAQVRAKAQAHKAVAKMKANKAKHDMKGVAR